MRKNNKYYENKYFENIKGKKYFELEDVDSLGLPWKILFVLGKKNIGKSYQIRKLIKSLKPDEQIVFGRFSDQELKAQATAWNLDDSFPLGVKGGKIIQKGTNEFKGYLVKFKNLQNTASMNYDKVKWIIFDEIIPMNAKEISKEHVSAFIRFVSNVERNNKNLKIIMFGNNNGTNELMTSLKVNVLDKFSWRPGENFLYINTAEAFEGLESQELTQGFLKYLPVIEQSLATNKPLGMSQRLLRSLNDVDKFEPYIAILEGDRIFEIKRGVFSMFGRTQQWFLIFENWVNKDLIQEYKCVTFDLETANDLDNVGYISGKHAELVKTFIHSILESKRFLYVNKVHISNLLDLIK